MNRKPVFILLVTTFLLWPAFAEAAPETVRLPLTLDYALIRSLFQVQAFNQPGGKAVLSDPYGSCNTIELWGANLAPEQSLLKISTQVKIKGGIKVLGNCLSFFDWEGSLEILQKVWVDKTTQQLRFTTVSSQVFNQDGDPAPVGGKVWNTIKTSVLPFFDTLSINLAFPVNELKAVLPLLIAPETRPHVEEWFHTIRLSDARVEKDAVRLGLLMDIEPLPRPQEALPEPSAEQIERLIATWETWDAFLVFQLETLMGKSLTEAERLTLFETVVGVRQDFVAALRENTLTRDFIRNQFLETWQGLDSILKHHLIITPSGSPLRYLTFFTAADALVALDKLGPALGIDMSRDGLLRLARLLQTGDQEPVLDYCYAVNARLRTLFAFGPPLDEAGPAFNLPELDVPQEENETTTSQYHSWWRSFFFPVAFAAEQSPTALEEIEPWIPSAKNIGLYLKKVRQVLDQAANETIAAKSLGEKYQKFYHRLVLATAWQESCWRQFIKANGKVRYLLSYNQSSVGLMQINERVWRGLYQPESLRWNIRYNARAGSEILHHYLAQYVLKKTDPANPLDVDTLAGAAYAMYNGGPGQFRKFLKRKETNSLYKSDRLFWEKYTMAKDSQFDKVSLCLVGR